LSHACVVTPKIYAVNITDRTEMNVSNAQPAVGVRAAKANGKDKYIPKVV